jgi:hypothetical protein
MRGDPASIPEIPHPRRIVPDLLVSESDEWYACGAPSPAVQGWKVYVPFTPCNAGAVLSAALPLIHAHGLHCKYIRSVLLLRKLNAGMFGYEQIGKNLVVYLPRVNSRFLGALKAGLSGFRDQCPAVPFALAFGDDLPLYYRYGAYRDGFLRFGSSEQPDDRASARAVPKNVRNRLARFTSPAREDLEVTRFLLRFPAHQALVQQGKCGVFRALNLESDAFQEVILKVGYHRGQMQPDGSDGCTFIRREIEFYKLLASRGLSRVAPALVDSLDRPRKALLALELIPGDSLLLHKLANRLTVEHLERCWEIIAKIHSAGLYLGDAKIANFLATDAGDLRVLDFEAAGAMGDPPPPIRTFLLNPEPLDPVLADQAHFLASVLFPYEEGRYSWGDRHVNLRDWLQDPPEETAACRWARQKLQSMLPRIAGTAKALIA